MSKKFREHKFISRSIKRLEIILQILNEYKEYLPLTLRSIHYLFLSRNDDPDLYITYQSLSNLISDARYAGIIPFDWIIDNSSYTRNEPFSVEDLAYSYYPDAWKNQRNYIEFVVEKYAIHNVMSKTTRPLYIITTYSTGFLSDTRAWDIANRMYDKQDKNRYIYTFSDYDPSGESMPRVNEEKIRECLMILSEDDPDIHFEKLILTEQQVGEYNLLPKVVETKDPRSLNWNNKYFTEIDAMEPKSLYNIIINEIEPLIDAFELINVGEKEKKTKKRLLELSLNN